MARKVLHETNYTFTPSTKTIVIPDHIPRERLVLITNVTTNQVIYNFSDPSLKATSYTPAIDSNNVATTTIVLNYNTAAMSATDKLQITPFGKFIRRTNLDELPQFYNVLKGDMSFIGPRPPIPSETELIEFRSKNGALHLRPGLTGWAQVNSFDGMSVSEKAKFDGEYASKISFGFEVLILLKTILYFTKKPPTY